MNEFDRNRLALVVARPEDPGTAVPPRESVSTGYFLTGGLVLTVRHVADRPDWTFNVRAETGPSEGDPWSYAKPLWIGDGDVDAMLLRTDRQFGNWALPSFLTDKDSGTWRSAGYARAAVDQDDNRKTLPLDGSFGVSGGQGPQELVLSTKQIIFENWDAYWSGISGAPVFSTGAGEDNRLAGIITEASRALANSLVGLPAKRLLEDIDFRSAITPSFLGQLPESRFCLVLTSEGSNSDLVKQTADVLKGFRKKEIQFQGLHEVPISIPALEAVRSPENWAATVDALARADYLIADVTSFEPVPMLLLGVRSVLRRGVTISVTEGQPSALSAMQPFNVKETRLVSCHDTHFYDQLHLEMAEGSANLARDPNYLDLPAYQAVRAPRPKSWAEDDDESLLVLCPFSESYSGYWENELRDVIRANTGDRLPLRMLDLRSPRLVGQALYEQVRWSSWCLVDWTEWRPNVFFELGVRLACSERDPMCIIQRSDAEGDLASNETRQGRPRQHELLLRLLDPVVYPREDPREGLESALDSWPSPPSPGRSLSPSALPSAATFKVAQASFQWQRDPMLTPPHLEQRQAAELILGVDPEKRPERLVLFAGNDQFDAELNAAVREKWIAAWLYLQHLSTADDVALHANEPELIRIANLVDYILSSSDAPRHRRLRKEIHDFLRSKRPRRRTGGSENVHG
jgi:hypothetical protein